MSYAISVPTPFNDISELAESFASRVDEERLMLPNADQIPEGEWVQFAVVLADGTAAIAGTGRCTNCVDNGEDRAPEHRFDVVMDSLQLDDMAQIYFERILQVRAAQMGEEPETGEVALSPEDEVEDAYGAEAPHAESPDAVPAYEAAPYEAAAHEAAPYEPAAEAFDAPDDEFGSEATQAVSFDEMSEAAGGDLAAAEALPYEPPAEAEADLDAGYADAYAAEVDPDELAPVSDFEAGSPAASRPQPKMTAPAESAIYDLPPPAEPGKLPSPHSNGEILTRRLLATGWSPEPALRPDPGPSSGLFEYAHGAGLPRPAEPPRPEMDPGWRVPPAPRPGDAYEAPAASPVAHDYAHAEHAEESEVGYAEAGEYAEQGEYDEEATAEGEALAPDAEDYDAELGAEDDLDFGDLPDHAAQPADETAQVEMPDDETA